MKSVAIVNTSRAVPLGHSCGLARTPWARMRGLLGRRTLEQGHGLLISPCSSIHMWGMKFPIDVVFLTRHGVVTDVVENIGPGKLYVAHGHHGRPYSALELPAGTIGRTNTQRGDKVEIGS